MRALLFLAAAITAALPAAAQQTQTPPAEPKKPEQKEQERRPLNLRLDNPSSFATTAPEEKKDKSRELPGLGEGARPLPQSAPGERGSAFPKDTNPGR